MLTSKTDYVMADSWECRFTKRTDTTATCKAAESWMTPQWRLAPQSFGVLSLFAASLYLARESVLAVKVIDEEMDHRHAIARMRKREEKADAKADTKDAPEPL